MLRAALWIFIGGYALAGWGAAVARDRAMALTSEDTALFEHVLWSTLHGRFAHNLTLDACHFADHDSFLLLALLPFYWAAPRTETLLGLQSAALALCAAPAFALARGWLRDDLAAFFIAAATVCHPGVLSQTVNQVHAPTFGLPVLIAAAWSFEQRRFGSFLLLSALACVGKENLALAVFMFGPVAWLQRRRWRWRLAPMAMAGGVLAAFVFWVAPAFGAEHYRSWGYFGEKGMDWSALAARWVQPSRLRYMGECFLFAGGPLPLLGAMSLLALPELAINMSVKTGLFTVLPYHFSLTVGAFLTLAAGQAAGRRRWGVRWTRWLCAGVLAAAAAGNAVWLSAAPFRPPPWHTALEAALLFVPDDPNVSVLAPHAMLSAVCRRRQVYYLDARCLRGQDVTRIDVVIVNLHGLAPRAARQIGRLFYKGRGRRTHRLAFASQGVFVFVRKGLHVAPCASTWRVGEEPPP